MAHSTKTKSSEKKFKNKANILFTNFKCIVPGDPQDVKATPVNSTTINVTWKPPAEKDRNGIIRGYHIHVQETREEVSIKMLFSSKLL